MVTRNTGRNIQDKRNIRYIVLAVMVPGICTTNVPVLLQMTVSNWQRASYQCAAVVAAVLTSWRCTPGSYAALHSVAYDIVLPVGSCELYCHIVHSFSNA